MSKKIDNSIIEEKIKDYNENGTIESFNYVYNEYYNMLQLWCFKRGKGDMAGDLMDIVFLNSIKKYKDDMQTSFKTYFFKSCKTYIAREWKRENVVKRKSNINNEYLNKTVDYKNESDNEISNLLSDEHCSDELEFVELKQCFESLKGRLTATEFNVIDYMLMGYNPTAIARKLGISPAAVNQCLKRLRKKEISLEIKEIITVSLQLKRY